MLQFGSFDSQRGKGSILAWSVGTETGYTLEPFFFSPRFSLRANVISGDHNANDANLQTFNPLFPKGKYFGEFTPGGPYKSSMCWALSDST
jgi:Alginate export